jgi:hypothetical protein
MTRTGPRRARFPSTPEFALCANRRRPKFAELISRHKPSPPGLSPLNVRQLRWEAFLSETVRNGISARLWRLPREFLLALINATAILVIVAAKRRRDDDGSGAVKNQSAVQGRPGEPPKPD